MLFGAVIKQFRTYLKSQVGHGKSIQGSKSFSILCEDNIEAIFNLKRLIRKLSGAKGTRIPDPLHAMQVLYQLSYGPKSRKVTHINQSKDFFRNFRNSYSSL